MLRNPATGILCKKTVTCRLYPPTPTRPPAPVGQQIQVWKKCFGASERVCGHGRGSNKKENTIFIKSNSTGNSQAKCTRLILPWHPSLRRFPQELYSIRHKFHGIGFGNFEPKVAWSLSGKSISRICLSDAKYKLTRAE